MDREFQAFGAVAIEDGDSRHGLRRADPLPLCRDLTSSGERQSRGARGPCASATRRTAGAITFAVLALSSSAAGQTIAGVVFPPVVPPGGSFTLTVTATNASATSQILDFPVSSVHRGSIDGPLIVAFPCNGCTIVPLPAGLSWPATFQVPATMLPDTYYLRVPWAGGGQSGLASFPVVVSAAWMPSLYPLTLNGFAGLRLGTTTELSIGGGACSSFPYIVAASNSMNVGFSPSEGFRIHLDYGTPLWDLSFPTPDPRFFSNFQGSLGWWGGAACSVTVPNEPALLYATISLQAVFIAPGGTMGIASNPLTMMIVP